jgi:hypothetical protein
VASRWRMPGVQQLLAQALPHVFERGSLPPLPPLPAFGECRSR